MFLKKDLSMRITESRLRRVVRSVIKENYYDHDPEKERHKQSVIKHCLSTPENYDYWVRELRNDFYDMSVGDSVADQLKSDNYPRWEKQDFIDVIIDIDGSYDY